MSSSFQEVVTGDGGPLLDHHFFNVSGSYVTWDNSTLDPRQVLKDNLGERYRSFAESIILTLVYSLIFLTGVVGNIATCIVIIKNSYMHTATNYYLFSLATSDALTLILGLPPELYTVWEAYPWRFGQPYCLFKTFFTEMTSTASILTITAFTVERFVAICYPFQAQIMSSLSRAVKIIIIIWIAANVCAIPYPVHARVFAAVQHPVTNQSLPDSLICSVPIKHFDTMRYVFQFGTFALFLLPMGVISTFYVMIGLTLRKSAITRQTSDAGGSSPPHSQSRRTILKMLVAVVVAFFLCWAPFHAQRLMTIYVTVWTRTLLEIQSQLFYISGVLFFVSSTVNPILYNLMSRKYREAFKETLCLCCRKGSARGRLRGSYNAYYTDRSTCMSYANVNSTRVSSTRYHPHHAEQSLGGAMSCKQSPFAPRNVKHMPVPTRCTDTEDELPPTSDCTDRASRNDFTKGCWKGKGVWEAARGDTGVVGAGAGNGGLPSSAANGPARSSGALLAAAAGAMGAGVGVSSVSDSAASGVEGSGLLDTPSHSGSSSPISMAAHIREELELSNPHTSPPAAVSLPKVCNLLWQKSTKS